MEHPLFKVKLTFLQQNTNIWGILLTSWTLGVGATGWYLECYSTHLASGLQNMCRLLADTSLYSSVQRFNLVFVFHNLKCNLVCISECVTPELFFTDWRRTAGSLVLQILFIFFLKFIFDFKHFFSRFKSKIYGGCMPLVFQKFC